MSTIVTINAGSSSFKWAHYEITGKSLQLLETHSAKTLDTLIQSLPNTPPKAIGHRVVHGGTSYTQSTLITTEVLKNLKELTDLAPLHNKPALEVIEKCQKKYGNALIQVAVFDTTFYRDMPTHSKYYAISRQLSEKYGIFRFGFHGISHEFLWNKYLQHTGNKDAKIITLHLGSGCSATAIKAGHPLDTSMGFTPNEGLVMATRCGQLDPEVVQYLSEKLKLSQHEILQQLNHDSGLLGLSGISGDMQTLMGLYTTDDNAAFAIDFFCYRILTYLGAYTAALGGIDAIIFTAGIGENSAEIRQLIINTMQWYGIQLDNTANRAAIKRLPGSVTKISNTKSSTEVYVIPTDENLQIAHEVASKCY